MIGKESMPSNNVYATFVDGANDDYLPGLQSLAASLRFVNSSHPMLVVVAGNPSAQLAWTAACLHLTIVTVPPISNAYFIRGRHAILGRLTVLVDIFESPSAGRSVWWWCSSPVHR